MKNPTKKPFRKRHLFARNVSDVVKEATKPLMNKQGKLYGALLSNWPQIVGSARAAISRPQRLQFPTTGETAAATLHLAVRPAAAPDLMYETEAMLEQCARYFGYRAIHRIVIHASHDGFSQNDAQAEIALQARKNKAKNLSGEDDMYAILARISTHVASASDKKNSLH